MKNNSVSGQAAGLVLVSSGDNPYPYSDHSSISFINNLVVGVQTTPMAVTSGSNINITGAFLLASVTSMSNLCWAGVRSAFCCTECRASGLQLTGAKYTGLLLKTACITMLPRDVIMSLKQ